MMIISQRSRVVIAFAVGVLVFAAMIQTCYLTYPWPSVDAPWRISRSSLRKWRFTIEEYKRQRGEFPNQLLASNNSDIQPFDEKDGWGFPFDYRRVEDSYELRCLGSDGRPGGTGLRGDFGPDDTISDLPKPSLLEFVHRDFPFQMVAGCIIAGLFACLMIMKKLSASPSLSPRQFLIAFVVTTLTSGLIGSGMVLFHMASKH